MYIANHTEPDRAHMNQAASIEPLCAFMLFQCQPQNKTFLTQHAIEPNTQSGALSFGAGMPVSEAGIQSLVDHLSNQSRTSRVELLPENVLSTGESHLCWYVTGQRRPMYYFMSGENRVLSVPWPTLVFLASRDHGLRVCALNTDQRPHADTPVFHAPLMNLYWDGDLCFGNVACPDDFHPASRHAWEAALFESNFTHTNHDETLHPSYAEDDSEQISNSVLLRFWLDLSRDAHSTVPIEALAPTGQTLGQWLEDE